MKIGMVGIGMMGQGIAANLVRHGHELVLLEHPGNQPLDALKVAGAVSHDRGGAVIGARKFGTLGFIAGIDVHAGIFLGVAPTQAGQAEEQRAYHSHAFTLSQCALRTF